METTTARAGSKVVTVNDASFKSVVLDVKEVVLVDFWGEGCPPCRAMAPIVDQLATEFAGKAKVAKANVQEATLVATKLNIRSIPTFMIFRGGQVVDTLVGAVPRKVIVEKLKAHVS